ncbi:MAG: prepilin-type N-terminal cleavage/methylation domain-containing protein [Tepidisphaeraceae bacterium]
MGATDRNVCPTGFTLVELLVVLVILVILLAVSAPMLRMFTGKRSIQAAQNQVVAALETARSQAITMREIRGVLFVLDMQQVVDPKTGQFVTDSRGLITYAPTGRIKAIMVRASGPKQPDAAWLEMYGVEVFLDGAGMDPITLPAGVMLQTIDNCSLSGTVRQDDNYIGFNRFKIGAGDITIPVGGVILFDADGRLATMRYSFRLGYDPGAAYRRSELGDILFPSLPIDPNRNYDQGFPGSVLGQDANPLMAPYSNVGLVLCDRDEFDAIGTLSDPQFSTSSNVPAGEKVPLAADEYVNTKAPNHPWGNEEQWLDEHAVPILINRVTGAVIKGE